MKFSHLIGTIKETIAEGQLKVGGLSTVTPSAPRPAPRPSGGIAGSLSSSPPAPRHAPTSPPAPRPAPTQLHARGGAIFGGSSQPTPVIDRAAASLQTKPAPVVSRAPLRQTPGNDASAYAATGRGMSTLNSRDAAKRATDRAIASPKPVATVAPSTATRPATRPATTPAPKPTPLQRSSAKIAQKKQSRSRPVVRPRPAARPIKRAQTYRQAADAGSSLSGAHQAGLRESLIREIKNIARKKNGKCDTNTEEGDNPKGAPDGFELNPRINSSIQNR